MSFRRWPIMLDSDSLAFTLGNPWLNFLCIYFRSSIILKEIIFWLGENNFSNIKKNKNKFYFYTRFVMSFRRIPIMLGSDSRAFTLGNPWLNIMYLF
jgi:hypothetical protein